MLLNYPLKDHTTLKIGGNAREAYFPDSVELTCDINKSAGNNQDRCVVIGEGSNLLISSQGVEEKVIFTKNLKNYTFFDDETVKTDCGIKSAALSKIMLENSLSGMEFLIGIPGSIGGAVTMNSSAHGEGIQDIIESVEIYDLYTCEIKTLNKQDLALDYRHSFVEKGRHLILSATFKLKKGNKNTIAERMEFHLNYRKENHPPLTEPNAGSTFRNPERKVYVGKLLEELGAKSWQEGGAKISDKHANFLINTGNATSLDVSRLMYKMHSEIKNNFGYDLIAEIRYIGIPTQEEAEIWKNFTVH